MLKKASDLLKEAFKYWAPPPDLSVSEWADTYRQLSREASAEPGRWRTSRAPYFREIMDSTKEKGVQKVIVKSCSQVGKTELILNLIGYFAHNDPSPIMLVQPTVEMAQAFSKCCRPPGISASGLRKTHQASPMPMARRTRPIRYFFPAGEIIR